MNPGVKSRFAHLLVRPCLTRLPSPYSDASSQVGKKSEVCPARHVCVSVPRLWSPPTPVVGDRDITLSQLHSDWPCAEGVPTRGHLYFYCRKLRGCSCGQKGLRSSSPRNTNKSLLPWPLSASRFAVRVVLGLASFEFLNPRPPGTRGDVANL